MLRPEAATRSNSKNALKPFGSLTRKALLILIWTIAWLMVLKEMNFDVRPLLAGAGVVGVAIGFGAQNIVKDVLGGLFLMLENQIRVNDIAIINGKGGLVEEINLRTVVLRGEDGAAHIFSNGSIQSLSNLTREYSYYVFSLEDLLSERYRSSPGLLKELADAQFQTKNHTDRRFSRHSKSWGVDQLSNSAVVIKARFKTLPCQQWVVGREMNRRIKKRFGAAKIDRRRPASRFICCRNIAGTAGADQAGGAGSVEGNSAEHVSRKSRRGGSSPAKRLSSPRPAPALRRPTPPASNGRGPAPFARAVGQEILGVDN